MSCHGGVRDSIRNLDIVKERPLQHLFAQICFCLKQHQQQQLSKRHFEFAIKRANKTEWLVLHLHTSAADVLRSRC